MISLISMCAENTRVLILGSLLALVTIDIQINMTAIKSRWSKRLQFTASGINNNRVGEHRTIPLASKVLGVLWQSCLAGRCGVCRHAATRVLHTDSLHALLYKWGGDLWPVFTALRRKEEIVLQVPSLFSFWPVNITYHVAATRREFSTAKVWTRRHVNYILCCYHNASCDSNCLPGRIFSANKRELNPFLPRCACGR